MKAKTFARKFDVGEKIVDHLDLSKAQRVGAAPMDGQHQRQHRLLHGPVVPTPGSDAQRQPRARSQTLPTPETQDGSRVVQLVAGAAIGLAVIAAGSPQAT